jgi:2-dehydropantoate 2-reductase
MFERLAVLGVGAIGGTIGGYLSKEGRDITLIDPWAAHVDAMKANGLRVTTMDGGFTTPVKAMHLGDIGTVSEPFDLVFISLKSYDTVWGAHLIKAYLKPTGIVVSAQNAINDELIAPIVGYSRDIACVVTLGAGMYEPAHVERTSVTTRHAFTLGELTGMPSRRAQAVADLMSAVGPTKVSTNIWGERWAKLTTNCMANSICALTGLGSAEHRLTAGVVDASIKIASEVVRVGAALGVSVGPVSGIDAEVYENADDPQVLEEIKTHLAEDAKQLGAGRPSMLQDVMKGRRTEIEYLNGYVAGRGREVGVATPVNEAVVGLVKKVERGEMKSDVSNIEHLAHVM